ncbi:M23 family metallopeptidase [Aliikangiella marina]|uniref:M23 family metallopeptidase n=1 Tax=Aliikangiella marina TaxID=1712262 RepID=A0A545TJR2_9GAMM|nr:M23 family metallopeptidase [Aliikangiella marina]TQV77464.1 M23 family metallopeptidase [Aliikangiella marina]
MLQRVILALAISLLTTKAWAQSIEIVTPNPQQGSMIIGKLIGEGDLSLGATPIEVDEQGYFVFGVGREAPSKIELTVTSEQQIEKFPIAIAQREWKIERVDGLPPSKVTPRAPAVLKRIAEESKQVRAARNLVSKLNHFREPFVMPAEGRISGVYGSQRILNGEPRRPHYGLDVANATGTPVVAAASGVVTLAHKDMFFSGGTLIIDHGRGISSTYIHLNSIDVKVGETVKQGQRVATIGATGRATGPHLDWRLNWFQTRLDPALLVDIK